MNEIHEGQLLREKLLFLDRVCVVKHASELERRKKIKLKWDIQYRCHDFRFMEWNDEMFGI